MFYLNFDSKIIYIYIYNGIALKNGTGFKLIYFILSIIFLNLENPKINFCYIAIVDLKENIYFHDFEIFARNSFSDHKKRLHKIYYQILLTLKRFFSKMVSKYLDLD